MLYQLSYGPEAAAPLRGGCTLRAKRAGGADTAPAGEAGSDYSGVSPDEPEWAFLDSNQRPLPYQGSALTS